MKGLIVLLNLVLTAAAIWLSYTLLVEARAPGPHPIGLYVVVGNSMLITFMCASYLLASLRDRWNSRRYA